MIFFPARPGRCPEYNKTAEMPPAPADNSDPFAEPTEPARPECYSDTDCYDHSEKCCPTDKGYACVKAQFDREGKNVKFQNNICQR